MKRKFTNCSHSIYTEGGFLSSVTSNDGTIGIAVVCYDPSKDGKKQLDYAYDMYSRTLKEANPKFLRKRR